MHGIVGSKRNWKTCSKTFLAAHEAHFDQSVTVDHRGHGNSHGFKTPHTVAACSDDLTGLLASLQVCDNPGVGAMPGLLSGHSFGGKVALLYIQRLMRSQEYTKVPLNTWILDSHPGIFQVSLFNQIYFLFGTRR
jgi:pimeloyl-ACP methyl ester carboxylesterase